MIRTATAILWMMLAFTPLPSQTLVLAQEATVSFNHDVRPILSEYCFPCHGPDAHHRQAELRLDVREEAIATGAIEAGHPESSELIRRILSEDVELVMPPSSLQKPLAREHKEVLQHWVAQGALYEKHWSFEKPVKPHVSGTGSAIDFLVRSRLTKLGLSPSPPADRRTLIRRLYWDLIGLPPTLEQVNSFVESTDPDAYTKMVEELLGSSHFGERMAIGWLDVVRFADTIGYHSDNPRNVWPYRDWVIQAFNSNLPFDQFTMEQIAGDLLPDADQSTRVASAWNRLLLTTEEGGAQPKDYESRMLTDRVRAVGTAWLGLTTGCAQCHDHKFDPFTTRDFYSLGAFFADIQEASIGAREPGMPVLSPQQSVELQFFDQLLVEQASLNSPGDQVTSIASLLKQRKEWMADIPRCLVANSLQTPRVVRILPRGNWTDETGEIVTPALPEFLASVDQRPRRLDRLDLARWLVSRDNPLTARTVMNRLWKQFFGVGLSRLLEDLGAQGEIPANQELLDWLACEFMDSGWDSKHMIRLIVFSDTYKQSSQTSALLKERDPLNREFARQSSFRLDAESIRDSVLCVSALLNRTVGGPSIKPYQPEGYWENLNFPPRDYVSEPDAKQYRRGIYVWWQRTFPHPAMSALDAPSREECVAERNRSNIPQQALVLLNDPCFVEAYRALAIRALIEGPRDSEQRLIWVWRQILHRDPNDREFRLLSKHLQQTEEGYQARADDAKAILEIGRSPSPNDLSPIELATWTHIARVVFNLHESITRH